MILDARTSTYDNGVRPFTLTSSVAKFLDDMAVGEEEIISGVISQYGEALPLGRVRMLTTKLKGSRRFITRMRGVNLVITRLA